MLFRKVSAFSNGSIIGPFYSTKNGCASRKDQVFLLPYSKLLKKLYICLDLRKLVDHGGYALIFIE